MPGGRQSPHQMGARPGSKREDKELAKLRATFYSIDKDGSGMISADELAALLRSHGAKVTLAEVRKIMSKMDADHDGSDEVSFAEYKLSMTQLGMYRPKPGAAATHGFWEVPVPLLGRAREREPVWSQCDRRARASLKAQHPLYISGRHVQNDLDGTWYSGVSFALEPHDGPSASLGFPPPMLWHGAVVEVRAGWGGVGSQRDHRVKGEPADLRRVCFVRGRF